MDINMGYELSYCILIGRFQPFHFGHKALLDQALLIAENVIVVLGSCNQPFIRTKKNPWDPAERMSMIDSVYAKTSSLKRIKYVFQQDFPANDSLWKDTLKYHINILTNYSKSIGLIGHEHDASSFYLRLFPEWKSYFKDNIDEFPHASKIRELYFSEKKEYSNYIPSEVANYLNLWKEKEFFKIL